MFRITNELNQDIPDIWYTGYEKNEIVFFDIETTGFSPETTCLYMIGCIYYQQNRWICSQWFADHMETQGDVLTAFFEFVKNYKLLICYNGTGFDIPYLEKKCRMLQLDYHFDHISCLDIYKAILPYKALIKTENLKQKTMEVFLGIHREDKYSGGELIHYYNLYLKNNSKELLDMLTLHNREDLIGMTSLLKMLAYQSIDQDGLIIHNITTNTFKSYDQTDGIEIIIDAVLKKPVPKRVSFGNGEFYIILHNDTARLTIKAYTRELKYFYPNYKDYYYLPAEDKSIHKSVAFYVDKNFRTKAKAANCYSKKTGCFLPQYDEIVCPYFKIDYYDKITYFEYTEDFIQDKKLIEKYFLHIFHKLMQ